jgi:hypothetical protein
MLFSNKYIIALLRILDVYPGSRIRTFSIPDLGSGSEHFSFRIPDPTKKSDEKYR